MLVADVEAWSKPKKERLRSEVWSKSACTLV